MQKSEPKMVASFSLNWRNFPQLPPKCREGMAEHSGSKDAPLSPFSSSNTETKCFFVRSLPLPTSLSMFCPFSLFFFFRCALACRKYEIVARHQQQGRGLGMWKRRRKGKGNSVRARCCAKTPRFRLMHPKTTPRKKVPITPLFFFSFPPQACWRGTG